MPQTVQKRAPGASRLPQRGQMPGPAEADRVVSDGADGSGAGAPQLVQKRTPSSSGAPHFVQVRGAAGCVDAVGSAGWDAGGYGAFGATGCSGSMAPQARQITALSDSCAPHFGQSMARPRFCFGFFLIVTSGFRFYNPFFACYTHIIFYSDFFRRQQIHEHHCHYL